MAKFTQNIIRNLKRQGIKLVLIPILCLFLIVPLFWGTIEGIFEDVSVVFSDVLDNINIVGDNLEIDQEYLSDAKKRLEHMGIDSDDLGLAGNEEYLDRFLEAEIVTNYPYLGGDGLQGTVYFERATVDGSTKQLDYISYDEFYSMKENGNSEIYDCFTVDTEDWTVHVIKNSAQGSFEVEKINYKNMVEKFSMPFEFTIALAMVSQNPQFALAVVDLVKDSRIVVTIAESKTTVTTNTTYSYNVLEQKMDPETGIMTSMTVGETIEEEQEPIVEESYYTSVFLSRANTWILNQVTDYSYVDTGDMVGEPQVTELEDLLVSRIVTDEELTYRYHINRKNTVVVTTREQKWNQGQPQVIDKTSNFTNLILRDSMNISGAGLVEIAKQCHDALANGNFHYGATSGGIPIDVNSDTQVDCSGYISWVLYEAGYTEMEGSQHTTHNYSLGEFGQSKGWDIITNVDDIQPGDICFYRGSLDGGDPQHVNICVGVDNGEYVFYDCGSNSAISAIDPIRYDMSSFGYAFRPNDDIAQSLESDTLNDLKESIQNYVNTISNGRYHVYVKNLDANSNNTISIGTGGVKSEGWLKLFIMATAYNEIKSGNIDENEISANIERMITTDSNDAANTILTMLGEDDIDAGIDKVNAYLNRYGYNSTNLEEELLSTTEDAGSDDNYTTTSDVGKLLQNIYNGTCVSGEYSEKMMNLLKGQILTQYIPSTVTEGTVANKTGEQSDILQDAAIVSIENANYVVVISATAVTNKADAASGITEIARMVNAYFVENGTVNDNSENSGQNEELDIQMNGRRVCYKVPRWGYVCPLDNLVSGSEMLFELLESNEKTQNHENLMRYLLYLLTNDSYGVEEFEMTDFLNGNFSDTTPIEGDSIQEKVWSAVVNAGYSEEAAAGVLGNIEAESGYDPTLIEYGSEVGFGLCQWSFGRRTNLEAYANSKGVSPSDIDTQIEFLIGEITPGGGANGYATYQLLNYNGYSPDDWINATTPEDAAIAFCWSFERPGIPRMDVRTEAARRYYEQFKSN